MEKQVLSGLNLTQIEAVTDKLKASKFRAKQIHNWIYLKSVKDIEEMTDLSKIFREELSKVAIISDSTIHTKRVSKDGTIKYLIRYSDQEYVETVLMRFDNRANLTACVSSQVGCAINCKFCATGKRGFIRNLTYQEIIEQILWIQRDTGLKVTNIVFMGQGEPLLNLDNVLKALEIFNKDFQISARRITVSTSGIIPQIEKLSNLELQLTLAVSIHSANHEIRKQLMPVENKYPLNELKKTLQRYIQKTGRRITVEYMLIKDLTDTFEQAKELAEFLKDLKSNINLIPYNPITEDNYKRPSNNAIMKFKYILEHSGKKVTIRLERGSDIEAACGQLRGEID